MEDQPVTLSTTTATGTTVNATPVHTPSTLNKIALILEAFEPLILAGVSPFVKNGNSINIINSEAPEVQAALAILAQL